MTDIDRRVDRALLRARETADFQALLTVVDPPVRGTLPGGARGPLAGVPFVAKDTIDTAGIRTTRGSALFSDHVPERNADCVTRLLDAGAALIGKSHTHEFAYGPTGDSAATGPALHPLDPRRITGGSSSGSAAAVALGIVPIALGTDTGGSARIPAALCGVVGFKPTHGATSLEGVFPLAPSLDAVGLLGATVDDVARAWAALGPTTTDAAPATRTPPRIAWVDTASLARVDLRVAATVRAAGGEQISSTVSMPELHEVGDLYAPIQSWEVSRAHEGLLADRAWEYQPDVLARLVDAARVTERDYALALTRRDELRESLSAVFADADILALPTCPITAPLLRTTKVTVAGAVTSVKDALLSLTRAWSVLGWPALSIPAGQAGGLPVGLQLIAAPGRDIDLMSAAHTLTSPPHTKEKP